MLKTMLDCVKIQNSYVEIHGDFKVKGLNQYYCDKNYL